MWLSGKESACQCRRPGLDPWVGKIPWRSKCNPLQYSCLRIPWTEEPGGLQSTGLQKESDTTQGLHNKYIHLPHDTLKRYISRLKV